VHDSFQEPHGVNEILARSGICNDRNDTLENASSSDISKGDALADEEGTGAQMSFEGSEVLR